MAYDTFETIQRFWQRFAREELEGLPPDERQRVAAEFESRFGRLMDDAAGDDQTAFADLVGLGPKGAVPFGEIAWPKLVADFDAAVIPSQLHAAGENAWAYSALPMCCAACSARGGSASSAARAPAASTFSTSGSRSVMAAGIA